MSSQGIALNSQRGLQLPTNPQLQLFLALPKTDAPIFFFCIIHERFNDFFENPI